MESIRPLILAATALFCASLHAENWPNWRGPNYNGTSAETNLPTTFSKTENVKWSLKTPGEGASTPVIWNNHVFYTSADPAAGQCAAIALDRETGKELWKLPIPGYEFDTRSNFASPSAVTDGERVFFFFGNGHLVACDFSGKQLWSRSITKDYGDFAFQWTFSSSPLLYDGRLYIQVLQRNTPVHDRGQQNGPSFLLALDPTTGKEIFKHIRPADAVAESLEAFTTPLPFKGAGRDELVIAGGDCLTGHDPKTGAELWRWGTWNPGKIGHWRLVPSPVAGEGVILACAPKKEPIFAVKAGLNGAHTSSEALAWKSEPTKEEPLTTDVPTPAYSNGRFYVLSGDARSLLCVEPKTGRIIYNQRLESRDKLESSPTVADGKIYVMNHLADVFVVKAGDTFELLHTAQMGNSMKNISRSSIAVSQGNLFIRTDTDLYCIGK